MADDGRLGDAPHAQVLPQVPQVVRVGVAVVLLAPPGRGLHVDVIPGDCVLHSCSNAPEKGYQVLVYIRMILRHSLSDCEEEPLVPGHVDAVQRQLALPVVWQVTLPWEGVGRVGLARVGVFRPL